ncbi:sporulation protein [Bacillus thermotolerans]|uniref:sporulation protein n=1 Tax=Bacillus thermotolerans TaxID=1221996 RepID=UPI000588EA30|nr:sporulation protein [Bacillus thermotolerans]KKB44750.1 Sporulation control protein Spo0M [Bacillus thermotolerans]
MIKKWLSRIGIGSARVDLALEKLEYMPGEVVTGQFLLIGGAVEREVKRISCDLMRLNKGTDKETALESITILSSRSIKPEQVERVNFTFRLPEDLQPTEEDVSYWFKTTLHFDEGTASKDQDEIRIVPSDG